MPEHSTGVYARRLPVTPATELQPRPAGLARPMVTTGNGAVDRRSGEYSDVDLGELSRVACLVTPRSRGCFREQAEEALAAVEDCLARHRATMSVTVLTVFLRQVAHAAEFDALVVRKWGAERPATTYVLQPPCSGAAIALECWAIGGRGVQVRYHAPGVVSVEYDGVRWICCGDSHGALLPGQGQVYDRARAVIARTRDALRLAGSDLEHVVRTWFYLGGIVDEDNGIQRYMELNRARTDAYEGTRFYCSLLHPNFPNQVYPASTGIGMAGRGLTLSCLALDTQRKDICLLPLENPQQTPAYAYHPRYSPQSPKFSRAMALIMDGYVTTWISGTASIVDSETQHAEDVERQTTQTLDNIERLISAENFTFHGVNGAGATLQDLAKVRVYVKRQEDYEKCRAVCEQRLGAVPAIYAVADVCRPELLVEIEGVAFTRRT